MCRTDCHIYALYIMIHPIRLHANLAKNLAFSQLCVLCICQVFLPPWPGESTPTHRTVPTGVPMETGGGGEVGCGSLGVVGKPSET